MITYSRVPKGGLGNRLFYLNFIGQLAELLGTDYRFYSPRDSDYFQDISAARIDLLRNRFVRSINLSKETQLDVKSLADYFMNRPTLKNFSLRGSYLGETFFKCSIVNPRAIIRHKFNPIVEDHKITCHFRGGDFRNWNPKSILKSDYYIQAIEYIDAKVGNLMPIQLVTDDFSLDSIQEVSRVFKERIEIVSSANAIDDFKKLMASRYLISSPSTFAIWAGVLSEKKEIIHSAQWVNERAAHNDRFWVDLKSGGNDYYSASQFI